MQKSEKSTFRCLEGCIKAFPRGRLELIVYGWEGCWLLCMFQNLKALKEMRFYFS